MTAKYRIGEKAKRLGSKVYFPVLQIIHIEASKDNKHIVYTVVKTTGIIENRKPFKIVDTDIISLREWIKEQKMQQIS